MAYLVYLAFTDKSEGLVSHQDEDESWLFAARVPGLRKGSAVIFQYLKILHLLIFNSEGQMIFSNVGQSRITTTKNEQSQNSFDE